MKILERITELEPRTLALLLSILVGLGMAVHGVFFFIALLIAVAAAAESVLLKGHSTRVH